KTVLFIAHRRELLDQAADTFENVTESKRLKRLSDNEIKMLNGILSNGTKYLKLSDFGYRKNKASLYYMGKERKVDEGILYLRNAEKGLAVVRILGDNMNPGALMMLANKINSSEVMDALGGQIKPLFESLSNQKKSEENKSI
ncbi:MAG: hypothetical protein ACPGCK_04080, partial [Flavobacteriaceae bacterium]